MKRQLTFEQYRSIDLALFAVMLALCEWVIVKAARSAFFQGELYTVSLAGAITAIVYMRWGAWGGIHAALAGALYYLYAGAPGSGITLVIYALGNLLSLLAVPVLRKVGHEKVRQGTWLSLFFALGVIVLMQTGRALVSLAFGYGVRDALGFYTTDALSIVFTLVVVWVARRLDGIFEEQRHYLLRVQNESEERKGG